MLKLVVIDLSNADLNKFEDHEKQVLPILAKYGACLKLGIRSVDNTSETHILYFPDTAAFDNFLADPDRETLQEQWQHVGAATAVTEVSEIDYFSSGS